MTPSNANPIYADLSRHQPVKRLLKLLRLLCRSEMTAADMRFELQCSDRTVRRLLVTLQELGIKVERRSVQKGYEPEPPHLYTIDAHNAAEALGLF